jgi:hypothetical protein
MGTKIYSSYAQINRELEILKIEREINYQKIVFGIQKTKDSLAPKNIVKSLLGNYTPNIPGPYGKIIGLAIPFITKWILKKRGR